MTPGPHDIVSTEDGWVVCARGQTFSDNTTEEARARHARHFRAEIIGKPGVAAAREALEGGNGS